jgi:hypothetical protein
VVATKYYKKHILRNTNDDNCRKCNREAETIQHVITSCPILASTDYKNRHGQVAKIKHIELAKIRDLLHTSPPYCIYSSDPYMENDSAKLYWDKQIISDKTLEFNKPDIVLIDRKANEGVMIDIAVPDSQNIQKTISTKITKYQPLRIELKRMWKLAEVTVVPVVLSATVAIPKTLKRNLKILSIKGNTLPFLQKAVLLQTVHITRKFLNLDYNISPRA